MSTAESVAQVLGAFADSANAQNLQRYFKTGAGEYGEGDQFIGVKMPQIRSVCRQSKDLPLDEVAKLVESPVHELRMAGLILLTLQYPKAETAEKEAIFHLYLDELDRGKINNWDLVDLSCRAIVGEHLRGSSRKLLFDLARHEDLWHRRVAIISTFPYIDSGEWKTTIEIVKLLLGDSHDLIHKAVGWALREVGKRCDEAVLRDFLDRNAPIMPRTMLRYAIEKLPEESRKYYLSIR